LLSRLASVLVFVWMCLLATGIHAFETIKVAENVYALVGPLTQRDKQNLGNNATFGVVITIDGVVLIDPGGSSKGAAEIDAALAKLTDKPVKFVVNTGGQDHRWFGNHYFKLKGAKIIAAGPTPVSWTV
jgi:glyoxylase-like metal-dependent hydrolase (beta-lactamase superfamily II)